MGRAPCCEKGKVKRGPWSPEEDNTLKTFLEKHGTAGNWIALPRKAGLNRCGKSCRLRWLNYLRPDIKHGGFTEEEDTLIWTLYNNIGSRWSIIASQLPGRTDNDVKNYWNTKLKKKLLPAPMAPKIEAPPDYNHQGKSLSYFDIDTTTLPLPNDVMMQQQNSVGQSFLSYHPIGGDHVELFEFGSSVSSSTTTLEASSDRLSSSSSLGVLPDQNSHNLASWTSGNVNYYDGVSNSNGIFMEYMGIMGFDSSNDFVLSGFGL